MNDSAAAICVLSSRVTSLTSTLVSMARYLFFMYRRTPSLKSLSSLVCFPSEDQACDDELFWSAGIVQLPFTSW